MERLLHKILRKIRFGVLHLSIRKLSTLGLGGFRPGVVEHDAFDELKGAYVRYVKEISRADMAASFECAALLVNLCTRLKLRKVLDLGSGFSSFALRRVALPEAQVWSVDDSDEWLDKTAAFLRDHNVNTSRLLGVEQFISSEEHNFDLIFLDLNFVEVRRNFIDLVVERCRPGGMIVFDDVHKPCFLRRQIGDP
jgi:predicted O-methyltransferase YrrM